MNHHESLALRERAFPPDDELLHLVLGDSYAAYEALQRALPTLEMEQTWQWYTPHKAWLARGEYAWTTKRGTRKEKTLYWLHVHDGHFSIAVWFKEKNRDALLTADLDDHVRQLVCNTKALGKLPTFPVVLDITTAHALSALYPLLTCKKELEC